MAVAMYCERGFEWWGWTKYRKHISGANMIELQNEQLANCLGFDEETFNYPPGGKGPLLSKANLSLLATSLPQRPVCLRLPHLLLLTSPLPPWVSASPSS